MGKRTGGGEAGRFGGWGARDARGLPCLRPRTPRMVARSARVSSRVAIETAR